MKQKNEVWEWIQAILIAIIAALLIRSFLFETIQIYQISMNPTFNEDDRVIISKVSYWFSSPKHGDIIVFMPPNKEHPYIKRVIGTPGDRVAIQDGDLYLNGRTLDEPYIKEKMAWDFEEVTVPEGTVFVMGDNRNSSMDSRNSSIGFIPFKDIWGKVKLCYWPLTKLKWYK